MCLEWNVWRSFPTVGFTRIVEMRAISSDVRRNGNNISSSSSSGCFICSKNVYSNKNLPNFHFTHPFWSFGQTICTLFDRNMTVNSFAMLCFVLCVCVVSTKQIVRLFRLIYLWENFFYFTFAIMANFSYMPGKAVALPQFCFCLSLFVSKWILVKSSLSKIKLKYSTNKC